MADENVQNPQAENEEMTAEQLDEQHRVRLEKLAALKAAGERCLHHHKVPGDYHQQGVSATASRSLKTPTWQ